MSYKGKIVQYVGRILRPFADKATAIDQLPSGAYRARLQVDGPSP